MHENHEAATAPTSGDVDIAALVARVLTLVSRDQ